MSSRTRWMGSETTAAWTGCVLAGLLALGVPAPRRAWAGPEGANVVRGEVSIETLGSDTVIHASDRSIIDYRSFDVGARETVEFVQPNESARVLNRIESSRPTLIDGALLANGRVYFVNPAGVYFGAGSEVNVAELVAAAGHISNEDFLSGIDHFTGVTGAVINAGSIDADVVRLVGNHVANHGSISAPGGLIAMVSGNDVLLGEPGSRLYVRFASGAAGDPAQPSVENSGVLDAEGGSVQLAGGDLLGLAIAHSGTTRAQEILLAGGEGGLVEVSGTLDASDRSAGGVGGRIEVTGERIALRDALLDASGDAGGGSVHVGGDFQGQGPTPTAELTFVDPETRILADALTRGDGGEVVVWADGTTGFHGAISARGGAFGGDGGRVEVSGKQQLFFRGGVDTLAPAGATGSLLLDPLDITIANGTGDGDADGTTTFAGDPSGITGSVLGTDTAPITIFESELQGLAASTNVTLEATQDITLQDLSDNLLALPTTGSVSFQAGRVFSMADTNDTIRTEGASLSITAPIVVAGNLSTRGASGTLSGAINVTSSGGAFPLLVRSINSGTATTTLSSVGNSILDDGAPATVISAGNLNLSATGATSTIGASAASANIRATLSGTLNASAPGGVFVTQTNTMRAGAIDGGPGNVSLTSVVGSIIDDGNAGTSISGNNLSLNAASANAEIGSAATPLAVTLTGTLGAAASTGTGGIFVTQSNDMRIGTVNAGTGNVVLTSSGGSILDDGVLGSVVTGNNLTLTANSVGASIGTAPTPVRATLSGILNASAANGPGGIFVTQTNAMRVGAISAGTGSVALATTAGAITDDGNAATFIDGSSLSLSAPGANGAVGPLTTRNVANLTASALGNISVTNSLGGDLAVGAVSSSAGSVTLRNDAGDLRIAGTISVPGGVEGSITLDTPYAIEFQVPGVAAGGNLLLNTNITPAQIVEPRLATIFVRPGMSGDPTADARNLTLTATSGNFAMGEGQTLSVPGRLQINAPGGSATIADVNALGLEMDAIEAFVYLRNPRDLFEPDGNIVSDSGGDVVANTIQLTLDSTTMQTLGSGLPPTFATQDGAGVSGAPDGTRFGRPFSGEALVPADFLGTGGAATGQVLDLRAAASTSSGSTDAVPPIPYAIRRNDGQLSQRNVEVAELNLLWGSELVVYLKCSEVPGWDPDRVPVACLGYKQPKTTRAALATPEATAARAEYRALLSRSNAIRASLATAFAAYRAGTPDGAVSGAGFREFLESSSAHADALDATRRLGEIFDTLNGMLSPDRAAVAPPESWQQDLLVDFTPEGMSPALLYEATGARRGERGTAALPSDARVPG